MSREFYWEPGSLVKDGVVSAACLVFGGAILAVGPAMLFAILASILIALGLASAFHAWRRLRIRYVIDRQGIRDGVRDMGVLDWAELEQFDLRYMARRSAVDQGNGIFLLTLSGHGKKVKIDSQIHDFSSFLQISALHAVAENAAMSQSTVSNLAALDLPLDMLEQQVPRQER